ncbi:MAG: FAD-dependent oxidoreductase, partial [Ottowia sp.]|nr:FAD-dependent oxidoreductase [Ottowia sp.]
MTQLTEIKVPDIGDFHGVAIIELFVKPGDTLAVDDSICTLESDKATLDIPSPSAGIVREVCVAVGDRVSQGSLLIKLEVTEAAAAAEAPAAPAAEAPAAPAPAAAPAPTPAVHTGGADVECDVLVLGAGPGGYSAAFRSADLGLKTVLVERYGTLGGVCLNVGCIPSKALLHVAAVMDEAAHFGALGVEFAAPKVDLDKLRAHKEGVVARLTGGLAGMAGARKVEVVQGV